MTVQQDERQQYEGRPQAASHDVAWPMAPHPHVAPAPQRDDPRGAAPHAPRHTASERQGERQVDEEAVQIRPAHHVTRWETRTGISRPNIDDAAVWTRPIDDLLDPELQY